jgi:hypothetical protein
MAENTFIHADLSAAQAAVILGCAGDGGVAIQIVGTFSGVVSFEGSVDGVNYRAMLATPSSSTTQVTSATAAGLWTVNAVGLVAVRARMSAFTSGVAQTSLRAVVASPGGSSSGGGGGGGTSSTFGDPFPAEGTAAGFIDNSGNMAGATLDSSGFLKVNVAAGSSGNAAASATGAPVPADADYLGVKDSAGNLLGVAATNLDYDTGAGTASQTVFGIALPASGGPVAGGTATNPVVVSGTVVTGGLTDTQLRATPVPVSGTVTVAQATASSLNATVVGTGTFAVQNTAATPAGSNVIGHVITDTGSTTAVTGTVTVSGAVTEASLDAALIAQEATTSGIKGLTAFGAVTTAAPSYTTAKSDALSLQTDGSLRTALTSAIPAGSNVIGHVIADTGSTTAVTGNVTVVQPTGTSLHAVLDTTSTTAVTQATGTNLHMVVDSGTITTVSTVTAVTSITNQVDANLKQVGGTNTVTAGVAGTQAVGGNVATNVAIGTNPINLGAQAVSAENTAVTATRMAQLVTDLVGKLIVLPYANPENFVSGTITSAMTGTTTTSLIGAPASGLRNYITQITVSNGSTTVPTDILIQDGSGGTTLYVVPAPAGTGTGTGAAGATLTFPTPLRQPTTATAIFVANVTTGSSTKVSASGYKGI